MNFAFLHGGGQGSWVWDETVEALRMQASPDAVNTLALDVPGCGAKRDRDTQGLTLEGVAQELIRDIENSGLRDVTLVGHSQAGQAMALMMGLKPELFSRFVYLSCSIPLPGQSVKQMVGNSLQGTNSEEVGWPLDPSVTPLADRYRAMFCNDMDETLGNAFLARLGNDQWPLATYAFTDWSYDQLAAVPSTFVLCLRDNILPAAWQAVFAERFRTERTARIDAGHQAMTTRPHTLAEILLAEAKSDHGSN